MNQIIYFPPRHVDAKIVNHYEQFKRIEELELQTFKLKMEVDRAYISRERWSTFFLVVIVALLLLGTF